MNTELDDAHAPSDTDELRAALYQLSLVETELARRRKERGLDYFVPNPPQLQALRAKARIVAYCGGNRAGKSSLGAFFLAQHLTKSYKRCACHGAWLHPSKQLHRPLKAVIVSTEFPIIERVIEPKLWSVLPKDWVAPSGLKRTPQGYLRRVMGKDGSTVDILSNEMDAMAFESADWDLAWIDEPTTRGRYTAILRGLLDRQGQMVLTFTPLVEPWMKEELLDKADSTTLEVVQADTYANLATIHGEPILTKDAIAQFEAAIPEEERATRIHGQFFHLRGLVYREYQAAVHEKRFEYQYPDPVVMALDPHDRLPHHAIWLFVDRHDWLYVDRELVINATIQELKRAILATEQHAGYKIRRRLIDPNFGARPLVTTGRTLVQELAMPPHRVVTTPAADDKTEGHLKVKDYLHWDRTKPVSFTNTPRLFFHAERVPVTIRSMKNYQYEEWRGTARDTKDPKEKERQKDTHGSDCVRYACMANLTFDRLHQRAADYELVESLY